MIITLDFETYYKTGTDKFSLKSLPMLDYVADERFEVILCGVKQDDQPVQVFRGDDPALVQLLKDCFGPGNTNTLLCHNTAFDGLILQYHYGLLPWRLADTQSMFRAIANYLSSSLESMAKALFPNDPSKRKTHEIESFDGYRLKDFCETELKTYSDYCANDVSLTYDCYQAMAAFFPEAELEVIHESLRLFIEPVLQLDCPLVEDTITQIQLNKETLAATAKQEHGISRTVLGSNKQFSEWLMGKGIEPPMKISLANGKPTVAFAKDDLEFIALQHQHPELDSVWQARLAEKSTAELTRCQRFLNNAQKDNGWLRVALNYHSAHTGRYGGAEKTNLQNLGRTSSLRHALCAEPDKLVYVADLSQIEARLNAWLSGQTNLVEAFRNGEDIYSQFASKLLNRHVDRKRNPEDKTAGNLGKTSILGLGYQMGAAKFKDTLAKGPMGAAPILIDEATAYRYVNTYRATYSHIAHNWDVAQRHLIGMCQSDYAADWGPLKVVHQRVILPNGLCLNYPNLDYELDEHTGQAQLSYWNGKFMKKIYGGAFVENVVQALAFVLIKEQLLAVLHQMPEMRYAMQVHDENIFVGPSQGAKERMAQLIHIMSQPPSWATDLPVAAEGGFAQNYSK